MKIYQPEPAYLVRLQITQQGQQSEYITLYETTPEDVRKFLTGIIAEQNIDPFFKGRNTSIHIREAKGGTNGKSKSFTFKGLTPAELAKLIKQKLTTTKK